MTQDDGVEAPELASLKFLVTKVLGAGKGGTVLVVTDRRVRGGIYAMRVVKSEGPDGEVAVERARAEFEAARKLDHPAILKVHDFRVKRRWLRVAGAELLMEYVEGKGLDVLKGIGVGPATLAFRRAAEGLAAAHRKGAVHGDLRPSRVLLARTGQVKLRGFGLPLVREDLRGKARPDANYAAPERIKDGVLDSKGDVYALGATFYHVLTGQPPVNSPLGRVEGHKISTPVAINPEIPVPLNDLVISCLQSNPLRRPASMFEVSRSLDGLVRDLRVPETALDGLSADGA